MVLLQVISHKFSGEKDAAAYWRTQKVEVGQCTTQEGNGESGNANEMAGKDTDSGHEALSPRHFRSNYHEGCLKVKPSFFIYLIHLSICCAATCVESHLVIWAYNVLQANFADTSVQRIIHITDPTTSGYEYSLESAVWELCGCWSQNQRSR